MFWLFLQCLFSGSFGWIAVGNVSCGGSGQGQIREHSKASQYWRFTLSTLSAVTVTDCNSHSGLDSHLSMYSEGGTPISLDYCDVNDCVGQIYCSQTNKETFTVPIVKPGTYYIKIGGVWDCRGCSNSAHYSIDVMCETITTIAPTGATYSPTTKYPSQSPVYTPTISPTGLTIVPSKFPSNPFILPTKHPIVELTQAPTLNPTTAPTISPTAAPTTLVDLLSSGTTSHQTIVVITICAVVFAFICCAGCIGIIMVVFYWKNKKVTQETDVTQSEEKIRITNTTPEEGQNILNDDSLSYENNDDENKAISSKYT